MKLIEILLLVSLFFSFFSIVSTKNLKFTIIFPVLSIIFSGFSIFIHDFRFAMFPAYMLSIILLVFSLVKSQANIRKRHPVLKTFGITVFFLVYTVSIVLPVFLPVINLPKPKGLNSVGTIRMQFTEADRKNILLSKASPQKIAVQVWYPAVNTSRGKQANWMDSRKAASFFAKSKEFPDLFGQLCLIKTNSYWNATLSNKTKQYPIILFSGGAAMFNGQNTVQMEELASQGYVVFAVSHPYDDFASIYPDGKIVPYSTRQLTELSKDSLSAIDIAKKKVSDESSPDFQRTTIRNSKLNTENVRIWSHDMSFIADQITKLNNGNIKSIFKGRLDIEKMGIFGHSFGGAAAGQTCLYDNRFKAFINMDGTPFGDTVDNIIKQPFIVLSEGSDRNLKFKAGDGYSKNQKNFLIVSINGSQHMNFTDLNVILINIGKKLGILGSIRADRQTEIMNNYIVSLFNKYLKGEKEPLLDSDSSPYTEVTIQRK